MGDNNKVIVRICGKDYVLRGTESEEYIQKIGLYVDKKMQKVLNANDKLSTSMAAVLTALNVVDDLHKLSEKQNKTVNELEKYKNEIDDLREKALRLEKENVKFVEQIGDLKLELAKKEATLRERTGKY